jgi:membrane associated rhomboid family serine protease
MFISVNLLLIIAVASISVLAFYVPAVVEACLMRPVRVFRNKEYHRLALSAFIHADYSHLFFNLFTFYFFGNFVEMAFRAYYPVYGSLLFLLLYILGAVFAIIPSAWKNRKNSNYAALGASGGVEALVFASILIAPTQEICLFAVVCLPGLAVGILYVVYSFYAIKQRTGNINHEAHLYGAAFGILFTALLIPDSIPSFLSKVANFHLF